MRLETLQNSSEWFKMSINANLLYEQIILFKNKKKSLKSTQKCHVYCMLSSPYKKKKS